MAWIVLLIAGVLEVAWVIGLKYTEGFTRFWPSFWTAIAMIASVVLLAIAAKTLPLGTAYVVWTGIGAVGAVIAGIFLFGESTSLARLAWVAVIIAGIVGLKMSSSD